jgi:LuxR family quorum sensing-dependent transcriptional regulator
MGKFEQTLDSISRVQRAPTPAQICAELLMVTREFGMTSVIAGAVPASGVDLNLQNPKILLDAWPRDWLNTYIANGYVGRDPVVNYTRLKREPFRWRDVRALPGIYSGGADIFDAAREFGLEDGLAFPMLTPDGSLVMLSLGGAAADLSDEDFDRLSLLATYALSRALQFGYGERNAERRIRLTARETECIRWAAVGKSEWEISQILGISEHTSEKHLLNAKAKLGATNRTHAVAEAIRLGYVV